MERRAITQQERDALHRFLKLELSVESLTRALNNQIQLEFLPSERRFTSDLIPAEPLVQVSEYDVHNAVSKFRNGFCSENDLIQWATMLLLNESYTWDNLSDKDMDELVDSLQALSIGGISNYEKTRNTKNYRAVPGC
jgi:hypothetical protein